MDVYNNRLYIVNTYHDAVRVFEFDKISPSTTIYNSFTYKNTTSFNVEGIAIDSLTAITKVEYELNNSGVWINCTSKDGVFNQLEEEYICSLSGLSDGEYLIRVRSTDSKTNTNTGEDIKEKSFRVDSLINKVRITQIGNILNVPERDSISYYFIGSYATIKGISEANSTLTFTRGSNVYTTEADSNGSFSINIQGLVKGNNEIKYKATDLAGNVSVERTLILIIGVENFPDWLVNKLYGVENNIENIILTNTPIVTTTISPTPTTIIKQDSKVIIIKDNNGEILKGVEVIIDGKSYTSNIYGEIEIGELEDGGYEMLIKYDGKEYRVKGEIKGDSSSIEIELEENTRTSIFDYWWICLVLVGITSLIAIKAKKYRKEN